VAEHIISCFAPRRGKKGRDARMNAPSVLQVLGLLAGSCGLPAGFFLLEKEPLFGVLAMLGAMALLLGTLSEACRGKSTE
jgi:hypothetical protein